MSTKHELNILVKYMDQCRSSIMSDKTKIEISEDEKTSNSKKELGSKRDQDCIDLTVNENASSRNENCVDLTLTEDASRCNGTPVGLTLNEHNAANGDNTEENETEDGMDHHSKFESLKGITIFDLIRDTRKLKGNALQEKEAHIFSELKQCSLEERKTLMKCSHSDFTPLSLACQIGNFNIADFFLDHCGADTYFTVYWAVAKRKDEVLKYLLAKNDTVLIGNSNLLKIASGIFPPMKDIPSQIKDVRNFQDMNWITPICFNSWPTLPLLDILIDNEAVEKCGKQPLFECLTECIKNTHNDRMNKDRHVCFEKIIARVPIVDDIKSSDGCTILSYAHKNNRLDAFDKLLERGGNLSYAQTVKILSMPDLSSNGDGTSSVTDNIDHLLDSILFKENTQQSDNFTSQYVHPVVHAVDTKNYKFLFVCLGHKYIPLKCKLDAVELMGAFFAVKMRCYVEALLCWNTAMKIRMNKHVSNITLSPSPSTYDILSSMLGLGPSPIRMPEDPDFSYMFRQKNVVKMLNLLIDSYNEISSPQESTTCPKKVKMQRRLAFGCQLEYETEDQLDALHTGMETEILLNSCLMYERLVGYNSGTTVDAFGRLAQTYMENDGKLIPYVSLVTYCLPFFTKYMTVGVPRKAVRLMLRGLVHIISKKALRSKLDFETIMKILKCTFIACFIPCGKENTYHINKEEFICLMVTTKFVKEHVNSVEQFLLLKNFLQKICKSDVRDAIRQTILHHCALNVMLPANYITNRVPFDDRDENFDIVEVTDNSWLPYFDGPFNIIHMFLESGANPNVFNSYGRTPLHMLFIHLYHRKIECDELIRPVPLAENEAYKLAIDALLQAGAHTDCVDSYNMTPIQYSAETPFQLCPVGDRTLQCLASCVISENNISYKDQLPPQLKNFIELHCKESCKNYNNFRG